MAKVRSSELGYDNGVGRDLLRRGRDTLRVGCVALTLAVSSGCGFFGDAFEPGFCPNTPSPTELGLAVGDAISVTLIEPWDQNSQFQGPKDVSPITCNGAIGFANGQTFVATLTLFEGDASCQFAATDSFTVGGWTWARTPNYGLAGNVLVGRFLANNGTCTAQLDLGVQTDTLPSGTPQPGQPPTATVEFEYDPEGASFGDPACPGRCFATMVATVEKL
jgi:hypothetical protein